MIENFKDKLEGKLPVNREELFELVSSWGRKDYFKANGNILIKECKANECYPLENLDVSQITDLSFIFRESYYNGDLSKWDISNVTNMERIFSWADFNNDSLKDWNTSKVENFSLSFYESKFNGNISQWNVSNCHSFIEMFYNSKFDGDISKWKFDNCKSCSDIFYANEKFENKYNYGKEIPFYTNEFLEWFETNRLNISNSNVSKEDLIELDDYLISFNKDINEIK